MRVSARRDLPGYREPSSLARLAVFLNGQEVLHCFYADEELGEVRMHVVAKDGSFLRGQDSLLEVTVRGRVEIRQQ